MYAVSEDEHTVLAESFGLYRDSSAGISQMSVDLALRDLTRDS